MSSAYQKFKWHRSRPESPDAGLCKLNGVTVGCIWWSGHSWTWEVDFDGYSFAGSTRLAKDATARVELAALMIRVLGPRKVPGPDIRPR